MNTYGHLIDTNLKVACLLLLLTCLSCSQKDKASFCEKITKQSKLLRDSIFYTNSDLSKKKLYKKYYNINEKIYAECSEYRCESLERMIDILLMQNKNAKGISLIEDSVCKEFNISYKKKMFLYIFKGKLLKEKGFIKKNKMYDSAANHVKEYIIMSDPDEEALMYLFGLKLNYTDKDKLKREFDTLISEGGFNKERWDIDLLYESYKGRDPFSDF